MSFKRRDACRMQKNNAVMSRWRESANFKLVHASTRPFYSENAFFYSTRPFFECTDGFKISASLHMLICICMYRVTRWLCEKTAQNAARSIFGSKLTHNFYRVKSSPQIWATSVVKNYPKQAMAHSAKIHPIRPPCLNTTWNLNLKPTRNNPDTHLIYIHTSAEDKFFRLCASRVESEF
jgi:hypothetical protein